MRFRIQDGLSILMVAAVGLAWFNHSARQTAYSHALEERLQVAGARLQQSQAETNRAIQSAESMKRECMDLDDEVLRLREVIKGSLDDQRDWFELEVSDKQLIAIRRGTSSSPSVSLQTVEQIEAATGLEFSKRLKHLMTPIHQLQLKPGTKRRN